ncbi:hypothetical protein SMD22_01430 (plasmid) [Brevibacillus halotolerans]|nr:hypothetical protein SMD22_01430 [Brevibacillus halotolerans]
MRYGDVYKHFKGGEYRFQYLCYPIDMSSGRLEYVLTAKHADTQEEVKIFKKKEAYFSDYSHYMVLYERILNKSLWVRKADDFFGYKEHKDGRLEKRFVFLKNN